MAWKDEAPILAGAGITKKQLEALFENIPKPKEPKPEPEITGTKINKVLNGFFVEGIEAAGGEMKLAQKSKLKIAQLKAIMKEVGAYKSEWDKINNPPEEPGEPEEPA